MSVVSLTPQVAIHQESFGEFDASCGLKSTNQPLLTSTAAMKNLNLFATLIGLEWIGVHSKTAISPCRKSGNSAKGKATKRPSLQHREDVLQVLQFRHQLLFDCAFQALNSLAGWTYEKAVVTERPLWPPVTELPSTNWLGVSRPSQMPFGIFPLSVLGN